MPLAPDTSTPAKLLYVAVHRAILPDVLDSKMLAPRHVMGSDRPHLWIPLNADPLDAMERARWGAEELSLPVSNPKEELMLFRIEFSALGFGYYCSTDVLTERNWKAWRFHGELLFPSAMNSDGQILATLDLCVVE